MKIKLQILVLWMLSMQTFASFGTRGGGHAVVCTINNETSIELFDFYEIPFRYKFNLSEKGLENTIEEIVNKKIKKIAKYDSKFSDLLKKEYEVFKKSHKIIPTDLLKKIYDSGSPINVAKNCQKKQFAINRIDPRANENKYLIDEGIWDDSSKTVKAGLILHEIIYAVRRSNSYKYIRGGLHNSERVRYFNALIHSDLFDDIDNQAYIIELFELNWTKKYGLYNFEQNSINIDGIHLVITRDEHLVELPVKEIKGKVYKTQSYMFKGQSIVLEKDTEVYAKLKNGKLKVVSISWFNNSYKKNLFGRIVNLKSYNEECNFRNCNFEARVDGLKLNVLGHEIEAYNLISYNTNFGVKYLIHYKNTYGTVREVKINGKKMRLSRYSYIILHENGKLNEVSVEFKKATRIRDDGKIKHILPNSGISAIFDQNGQLIDWKVDSTDLVRRGLFF